MHMVKLFRFKGKASFFSLNHLLRIIQRFFWESLKYISFLDMTKLTENVQLMKEFDKIAIEKAKNSYIQKKPCSESGILLANVLSIS